MMSTTCLLLTQPLINPWHSLNGVNLTMEIDADAAKSLISENTFAQLWPNHKAPSVKATSATLKTYTGKKIKPVGVISVSVEVNKHSCSPFSLSLVMASICLGVIDWLTFASTGHSSTDYMFQMNCKHSLIHVLQCSNLSLG